MINIFIGADDNFYMDLGPKQGCMGDVLEVTVLAQELVTFDNNINSYIFRICGIHNRYRLYVEIGSDLDRFLAITMHKPIWLWVSNGKVVTEISNYGQDRQARDR